MTRSPPLAIVLLSGGLDSMVSAAIAREQGFGLLALTVDYNQRHRIEIEAAGRIAARLGAERHIVLPLDLTGFGGSALTADIDVPKAGVEEGVIPVTYVLFPDEGHGFAREENSIAFFAVSEAFLTKHLGGRSEPIGDAFKGSSITVPQGRELVPGLQEALPGAASPGSH